ncbi:SRPBCC family protein [Flavihumibacter petaseus]|nr:SRPBCC family protein [Flavihumibacter petaseus]
METANKVLTVETTVNAPVARVWEYWNEPAHVTKWAFAIPEWHAPRAENDLRTGGRFMTRMEARDGSMGFDFGGEYTAVTKEKHIAYTMDDGRKVTIDFVADGDKTRIIEAFEPENENPLEMQQGGWQSIMNNFKQYAEGN